MSLDPVVCAHEKLGSRFCLSVRALAKCIPMWCELQMANKLTLTLIGQHPLKPVEFEFVGRKQTRCVVGEQVAVLNFS